MKGINLYLEYKADDEYDNKLYDELLEVQKCIASLDDLFIEHVSISPLEEEDE